MNKHTKVITGSLMPDGLKGRQRAAFNESARMLNLEIRCSRLKLGMVNYWPLR